MSLLTATERRTLIDLLLQLPNSGNAAARNLLLSDLPADLQNAIAFDNASVIHITNIVNTASSDAWERLPNGSLSVAVIIENAQYMVRGSRLAGTLETLLNTLKSRAAQIPGNINSSANRIPPP